MNDTMRALAAADRRTWGHVGGGGWPRLSGYTGTEIIDTMALDKSTLFCASHSSFFSTTARSIGNGGVPFARRCWDNALAAASWASSKLRPLASHPGTSGNT